MATLLSKSSILAAKLPHRDVEVPEWGGFVRVQAMSLATRIEFIDVLLKVAADTKAWKADPENVLKPALTDEDENLIGVIYCIVDEAGDRLFDLADADDLRQLSSATLGYLYVEFIGLNQFGSVGDQTAVEAEKKD